MDFGFDQPTSELAHLYTGPEHLGAAVAAAAQHGLGIILRARSATVTLVGQARAALAALTITLDSGLWASQYAEPAALSPLDSTELSLFETDNDSEWGRTVIRRTGVDEVLYPAYLVRGDDWASLSRLVDRLAASHSGSGLLPFVPVEARALDPDNLPKFINMLAPLTGRRFAVLFTGGAECLSSRVRLSGLAGLCAAAPAMQVIGLDTIVGSDTAARGNPVAIGISSSLRWPAGPRDHGRRDAEDAIPGLLDRTLIETRSPSVFADWYVNAPAPRCSCCGRAVDRYRSTPSDRSAVIAHNARAIAALMSDLFLQPKAYRASWIRDERVSAFERHAGLNLAASSIRTDRALRWLCERDDALGRQTTPVGTWR